MRKWLKLNALRKRMKTSTFLPLPLSSHCHHSDLLPSLRTKLEKIGRCKTMPSPSIQGTCQNWAQQPFRFKMWCHVIISGMAILFECLKRGRWSCKILSCLQRMDISLFSGFKQGNFQYPCQIQWFEHVDLVIVLMILWRSTIYNWMNHATAIVQSPRPWHVC